MEVEGADGMVTIDFAELEGMLRPIISELVQDAPSTSGVDVDQLTQRTLAKLWKLIHDSNEDRAGHLAGIPLPEVDAELLPLQKEVDAVLARLNARRAAVPAAVEAATRARLEALRRATLEGAALEEGAGGAPAAGAADGGNAAAEGEAAPMATDAPAAAPAAASPAAAAGAAADAADAADLLARTTATTDRLPGIRARLDEALQRLQTNLAILGEGPARQSPRTVEKVMMRAARAAAAGGGPDQTPPRRGAEEGEGGEESGADATRRCLARELA